MKAGDRVKILVGRLAGRIGIVMDLWRDPGCGCSTVFVRTDLGEWAGSPSEVEPA